jgi:hypothetical protein
MGIIDASIGRFCSGTGGSGLRKSDVAEGIAGTICAGAGEDGNSIVIGGTDADRRVCEIVAGVPSRGSMQLATALAVFPKTTLSVN